MRLRSSMQPISTRRWPWKGSRPVVSVSSTISRMEPLTTPLRDDRRESSAVAHVSDCQQNVAHLGAGVIETLRTVEHEVGAPAFFRVRHLLPQQRGKFLLAHARPLEGALALELGRR